MTDWSTTPVSPTPPSPLPSGLSAVKTALKETGAVGFVHVGRRYDADRRYLTRVDGPDRETGIVYVPHKGTRESVAVYCVPTDVVTAVAEFEQEPIDDGIARRIEAHDPSTATGHAIRTLLADRLDDTGVVLVPRTLPHDTAVLLQQAGYELRSTAAITAARATKTAAEHDCLRAVQQAAAAGVARGEAVVAASEPTDGTLVADGRPLTATRLRRLINAELASCGVSPAGNTTVGADSEPTDRLPTGRPIRLTVAPRGPHGYHGCLTRTVAVDTDGGWQRRAFIAAEAGLEAARRQIDTGADVSVVEAEAVAEVGAYGFAITPDEGSTRAQATATVSGIGLSTHEPPAPGTESKLQAGSVIAVETGVVDPDRGAVRLGTVCSVSPEGTETFVDYPYSLTPADRTH